MKKLTEEHKAKISASMKARGKKKLGEFVWEDKAIENAVRLIRAAEHAGQLKVIKGKNGLKFSLLQTVQTYRDI